MENVHAYSLSAMFIGVLNTIQTVIFFSSFLSDEGVLFLPFIVVFHVTVCWGYF